MKRRSTAARARRDGLINELAGLGGERDTRLATRVGEHIALTEPELSAFLQSSWAAARVVEELPDDATRKWVELSIADDPDTAAAITDELGALGAREQFARAMRLARLYGGAAIFLGTTDKAPLESELPSDAEVTSLPVFSRFRFEPVADADLVKDVRSQMFGQPEFLRLTGLDGAAGQKIHVSRLLVFRGRDIGDDHPTPPAGIDAATHFWGQSVIDHCWDPLRKFQALWDYAEANFKHLSQAVLSIEGYKRLLAENRMDVVLAYLKAFQAARSTLNVAVVDSKDALTDRTVEMVGFWDGLLRAGELLAGAAKMPLTKLFGAPPAGLSTDDASGERNWYDYVAAAQRRDVLPPLRRLISLISAVEGLPDADVEIRTLPLREETADQISQRRERETNVAKALWEMGSVTAGEVRESLRGDPENKIPLDPAEDERIAAEALGPTPDPAFDPTKPDPSGTGASPPAEASKAASATAAVNAVALNGAQVTSAMSIVVEVAAGRLPRASGVAMLSHFFGLSPDASGAIMGEVGLGFVATSPGPAPQPTP